MRLNRFLPLAAFAAFLCADPASAQTVAPAFAGPYTLVDLGTVANLPTAFGGLTFKSGDPNTLLIGGGANGPGGRIYEVPVTRGAGGHIASFGTPTALGFGQNNDSGIAYGPGGLLFHTRYPSNELVQVKPGSNASDLVTGLSSHGIANSPGALAFVPPGFGGAGSLKISSYAGGAFYEVPLSANGDGTFALGTAVARATLPGGPEGLIYAPAGSPLFTNPTLLVTEYSAGKVAAYDVDANGDPIVATRRDFVTGLSGGEGAAIDPVTGDFLFTTFGGGNKVIQVRGFTPPPPRATVVVTSSANPASFGASVTFTATVSGVAPLTGAVTFKDGGTDIAGCVNVALASGIATCVTSALPVGTRTVAAFYGGNSTNSASDASVAQVVNGLAPTANTDAAFSVRTASANLGATVASRGLATTITFRYGTTAAYGSSISATPGSLAATASGAVAGFLTGLACGTTYHYAVRATNAAGTTDGADATFTTAPCATLASVQPARGPLAGGTTVTLTGTGFAAGMTVNVDGVAGACRPVALAGATSATCVMPAHAAGAVGVTVSIPGGTTGSVAYTYDPAPAITAVSPVLVPTGGGTIVTITGSGFIAGASVSVGGVPGACTPVVLQGQSSLTCTIPLGAPGPANVTVVTSGGTSNAVAITYGDLPTVSAVSPARGPLAGGTQVTITGTACVTVGNVLSAQVGGAVCTNLVRVSDTQLTCTTPAGVAGAANVVVTTIGGASAPGTFTYDAVPTVTQVKPSQGPVAGGTLVTVSGTSFIAGASTIVIDGQPCVPVTHLSDAKLTCVTPASTAGAKAVTVTTPGGTSAPGSYTYDDVPTLAAVNPAQGPVAGGTTITLTGTSFIVGRTSVAVGAAACASVTVIDSTTATCVVPAQAAGIAPVTVTTPGGTSGVQHYTYDDLPTVTGVSPGQGPVAGGTTITVTGTAFIAGTTTVTVGGAACVPVTVTGGTSLTCTTPAQAAGVKDVVVATPGGVSAPGSFTYDDRPSVASVSPPIGPLAGGTAITVTGAAFVNGSTTVTVDGAACVPVAVSSDNRLTCTTPAGTAGVREVIVTTPGGSSTPGAFTYAGTPSLATIAPAAGPLAGGTTITLTGTAFVAGTTTVTIGGSACTAVTVASDASLTCTSPARPAGPAVVTVATPGGTSNALSFLYEPVPALSAVAPVRGPVAGGTLLTLTGTGFTASGTAVDVGGAACTSVNVVGPTQLTCVAPARPAGAVAVAVTTAGGTSGTSGFTFDPVPAISGVSPSTVTFLGGVTLTVTGSGFVTGLTTVTVGGAACAAVNVTAPGSLTCVSPAGAAGAAVPVVATTPGGTNAAFPIAYLGAPTLGTVNPAQGPAIGGTTITLTGTDFVVGGTVVTIGGAACGALNVTSATSATCVTPAGTQGSASVVVTTMSGPSNGVSFVFDGIPTVTSITPGQGSVAGGATVTVTGTAFVTGATTVTIGGANCAGVTVLGPSSLTCTTPAGAAGTASVVVTTPNGTSGTIPYVYAVVVNGSCGPAAGVGTAFRPAVGLCANGTASPVLTASPWSWSCAGSGGGTTAACTAPSQSTATGTGTGRAVLSGGTWIVDVPNTAGFIPLTGHPKSPPTAPPGIVFPHGLLDFTLINGAAGSAATITITYPQALPPGTQYWKYGPSPNGYNCIGAACSTPHWYVMPAAQAVIAGNTITLTIFDGGVGDDDLAANAIIVDQGGPGVPPGAGAIGIPTLSEWSMAMLASLLLLVGAFSIRRARAFPAGRNRSRSVRE